jgi:hypothetical protein
MNDVKKEDKSLESNRYFFALLYMLIFFSASPSSTLTAPVLVIQHRTFKEREERVEDVIKEVNSTKHTLQRLVLLRTLPIKRGTLLTRILGLRSAGISSQVVLFDPVTLTSS